MTVTTVTTAPLAQVQADTSDLFGELVQDWHTGRRLWARGYDIGACLNEAQMDGWADAEIGSAEESAIEDEIGSAEESAIEDDYSWIRTGC